MRSKHLLNVFNLIVMCVIMLSYKVIYAADEERADANVILDRTPYALLLKELICLTDTIGLLRHNIQADERRFIEDSVLGKVVRIYQCIKKIDFVDIALDDVDYLNYWISIAEAEPLPHLLSEQISILQQFLHRSVQRSLQPTDVS